MYHPSRGGVRGGRDQFNWEDIKADKHRENYLGHSVKAPVGRWQKGKDLYWYTKDHGSDGSTKEEIKRIQEEEEEAMKEMLGLAPRKNKRPRGNQLDKREVDELLKKGKGGEEQAPAYVDGERVQGLGFAPAPGQTDGQSGGKRAIQVTRNENVALPPEQINSEGLVKETEKDVGQHIVPSANVATSPGVKTQQDTGVRGGEDEPGSGKKRQEEKGKARELRREEKRARKKALKDASGHRSKDGRMDSSRRGRHESKGRTRHERKETSPDYHNWRKEGHGKARYDGGNDSDSSGEKAGRLSTGHKNRRSTDYGSSSEGEPFKPYVKYKGSESPTQRDQKIRRQDADLEKKSYNSSTSCDDSAFVQRHRRVRKEDSPIRTHHLGRRHDFDNQGYVDPGKENRLKKERREDSPISPYRKQRKYDSDGDGYASDYKYEQRRREWKEASPVRRYEKQGRHDLDSEGHRHHRDEDQRWRGKKEESPTGKYRSLRRHDSDSEGYRNSYKQGHRKR